MFLIQIIVKQKRGSQGKHTQTNKLSFLGPPSSPNFLPSFRKAFKSGINEHSLNSTNIWHGLIKISKHDL